MHMRREGVGGKGIGKGVKDRWVGGWIDLGVNWRGWGVWGRDGGDKVTI